MTLLLKILSRLPFGALYILSDLLALIAYRVIRYRRDVVLQNLRNSFPEKNNQEIERIAKDFYQNLADIIIETLKAITIKKEDLIKRVHIKNIELVEGYMKRNQSIMVVATHQCNWEWVLMSGSAQWSYPLDAVYLPLSNKKIDKLMLKTRSRFGGNPIPAQNVISEMKRRQHITVVYGMLADQVPPKKSKKYWAKFMNQETAFLLGPEQLPKLFNYPVIFLSTTRLRRGYYQIDLKKVAEPPYSKQGHEIMDGYIKEAEALIHKNPADWLWSHRRWKYSRTEEGLTKSVN